MDLLRLVLARQPIAGLTRFRPLLRSRIFVPLRESVYNIAPNTGEDHIAESVVNGDLSPEAQNIVYSYKILNRAIFLQNINLFTYFAMISTTKLDFWYAIGSGIPEIQAFALMDKRLRLTRIYNEDDEGKPNFSIVVRELDDLVDPASILWTPALQRQILALANYLITDLHASPLLFPKFAGMAGIWTSRHMENSVTWISAKLGYRPSFTQVPEVDEKMREWSGVIDVVEVLVRSRYFFPLINGNYDLLFMVTMALTWIDYDLLLHIVTTSDTSEIQVPDGSMGYELVPRSKVTDSRKCLDDPRIFRLIPPIMNVEYRAIAGDASGSTEATNVALAVGNPIFPAPVQARWYDIEGSRHPSIQGILIYSPRHEREMGFGLQETYLNVDAARGHLEYEASSASKFSRRSAFNILLGRRGSKDPDYPTVQDIQEMQNRGLRIPSNTLGDMGAGDLYGEILGQLRG